MFNKKREFPDASSDIDRIGPNVFWNGQLARWDTIDKNKDTFVIDIINNYSKEGYISIKRAPATAGEPSFTELFKMDSNGYLYIGETLRIGKTDNKFYFEVYEDAAWDVKFTIP